MRWVMITPSYGPDFLRCKILCSSIDVCVPEEILHVLIVDRRDRALFASLESKRRRILVAEDMLPWWIFRIPLAKRWWLSLGGKPIRNWVLQQVVKIQAAATIDADAVLFLDSDVAFVRPFSPQQFESKGIVALHRVSFTSPQHARWLKNAVEMLGAPKGLKEVNYIGNLVTWRVDAVRALVDHLGRVRRRHWIREFTSRWSVSEYMVYGAFVEHIVGMDEAGHFAAAKPLIHLSWGYDLTTAIGLSKFFGAIAPNHVAIMIHSKDCIDPKQYLPYMKDMWEQIDSKEWTDLA